MKKQIEIHEGDYKILNYLTEEGKHDIADVVSKIIGRFANTTPIAFLIKNGKVIDFKHFEGMKGNENRFYWFDSIQDRDF